MLVLMGAMLADADVALRSAVAVSAQVSRAGRG
jgi:hypothetical protein